MCKILGESEADPKAITKKGNQKLGVLIKMLSTRSWRTGHTWAMQIQV